MLKSLFFNIYLLIFNFSFYLFITIAAISFYLLNSSLRSKFIYFLLNIVLFSIWGFIFDLDGIILVFLTAEFTIFLLFLMTYIQLYSNYSFVSAPTNYLYLIGFFVITILIHNQTFVFFNFISYYKCINHLVSSDFYILYYFLFEKLPLLVIFFTLIISFFSFFFIIMYFSLKLTKLSSHKNLKNLYYLRKQILIKQTNFNTKLHTFQN